MPLKKYQQIALGIAVILGVGLGGWFIYASILTTDDQVVCTGKTITDAMGRKVCVPLNPTRIVSIAPSITEMIFAINASDRMVGRSHYCDYPVEVSAIEDVGGFWTPDLEKIRSVDPDVIFFGVESATKVASLETLGVPVVVINPETINEVLQSITLIGYVMNATHNATLLVNSLQTRIDAIATNVSQITGAKMTLYYEVSNYDGIMAAGALSFIHDVIVRAGGINIFATEQSTYPMVSEDVVITANPDVILVADMGGDVQEAINVVKTRSSFIAASLTPITKYTIYAGGDIYERAGPRVVDGLENLYARLKNASIVIYEKDRYP